MDPGTLLIFSQTDPTGPRKNIFVAGPIFLRLWMGKLAFTTNEDPNPPLIHIRSTCKKLIIFCSIESNMMQTFTMMRE